MIYVCVFNFPQFLRYPIKKIKINFNFGNINLPLCNIQVFKDIAAPWVYYC